MERFGIRFVGVNEETGQKLLLTVALILAILLLRAVAVALAQLLTGRHRNERVMFWTRQGASIGAAVLGVVALLSIWFDDPQRLTTGLGIFSAGLGDGSASGGARRRSCNGGPVAPVHRPDRDGHERQGIR